MDPATIGALISAGASLIGGERRNKAQAEQAAAANAFSASQFATRYQTTVKDMEAAGLNPMLAYSQGGGSPPSGQQAQMQDTFTPAVESFNRTRSTASQNALQNSQVRNVDADTRNKEATTANIEADTEVKLAQAPQVRADTLLKGAQENLAGASADQARTNIAYLETQSKKIVEEIKNIPIEGERLKALVKNLGVEYDNIVARTHNTRAATDQIKWLAVKTMIEGDLLNLDLKAATDLENIGRYSKEGKIVLDILRLIKGSR
jgi:hypothetical protein